MSSSVTRRSAIVGISSSFLCTLLMGGCSSTQSKPSSTRHDSTEADLGSNPANSMDDESDDSTKSEPASLTPYERVIASNSDTVSMTISELSQFIDTFKNTQYKVRGLVTPPDTDWDSRMYSPTDADPSKYIEVDYVNGPWPRISETEELELYLEPGYVYKGVVNCDGSTTLPEGITNVIEVDFETMYSIVEKIDSTSIEITGYISRSSIQNGKSSYVYYDIYEDANALIRDDADKRFPVQIKKSTKVKDGDKVRVAFHTSNLIRMSEPYASIV